MTEESSPGDAYAPDPDTEESLRREVAVPTPHSAASDGYGEATYGESTRERAHDGAHSAAAELDSSQFAGTPTPPVESIGTDEHYSAGRGGPAEEEYIYTGVCAGEDAVRYRDVVADLAAAYEVPQHFPSHVISGGDELSRHDHRLSLCGS